MPNAPRRTAAWVARFWAGLDRNGPTVRADLGPCWLWTGRVGEHGYGALGREATHRIAWRLAHGPLRRGQSVLHRCDVRRCCRLSHLFLGTHPENMADMVAKGRAARGDRNAMRRSPEVRPRGERNGAATLTAAQVLDLRRRAATGAETPAALAVAFGISARHVRRLASGGRWAHLSEEPHD